MTMTEKLDLLMGERGLNKAELARNAGIPYMTIVNFYAKGTQNVKRATLLKLSSYFHVTVDYLAVDEETRRAYPVPVAEKGHYTWLSESVQKPRLLPNVPVGELLIKSNIACYDEVPGEIPCDFSMRFSGDSMERIGIQDGDIVFILQCAHVDNNQVAAIVLDGKLTLRRVYCNDNSRLVLLAENPTYAPLVVTSPDRVRILGKAVAYLSPTGLKYQE